MAKKNKNYKKRSKVYSGLGTLTLLGFTGGGFFGYEIITDWSNFKNEFENFVVIQEDSFKVNIAIALPALIALLVFVWVYRKKHKKALEGKVAFSLFFLLIFLWIVYSIIEVVLFTVMGAFVGSAIDEALFMPLSNSASKKAIDDHDVELEMRREKSRRKVREEIDGTV